MSTMTTLRQLIEKLEKLEAMHGGSVPIVRFETMPGSFDFAVPLKLAAVEAETVYVEQFIEGNAVFVFEPVNHATQQQIAVVL